MKRMTIRVTDSMHEWLHREFPPGFRQSFVEECFNKLRAAVERGELPTFSDYSTRATLDTLKEAGKDA